MSKDIHEEAVPFKKNGKGRPTVNPDCRTRISKLIRKHRLAAGLEQSELGYMLGYTATAVGGWELGRTRPSLDVIPRLCSVLKLPIHELMGTDPSLSLSVEDERIYELYHALDNYNRETVTIFMERLLKAQECAGTAKVMSKVIELPFVEQLSPAAGTGVPAPDYAEPETIYLRKNPIAEQSDMIMRVNGSSMEPSYPDGSLIYVKRKAKTHVGEVGIFVVDGEVYCKERHEDCLYSINRMHADIPLLEDMSITNYGRVLGIVSDEDMLTEAELENVQIAKEAIEA